MKLRGNHLQRGIEGLIVYGIGPTVAVLALWGSAGILLRLIRQRHFESEPAIGALALLLIGLGLLQFTYSLLFKKDSKLSTGVIYLASVTFMILGVLAAVYPFTVRVNSYGVYTSARGVGVFFVGLLGLAYARHRKKQTPDRTATSDTPPAGQEARH